MGMRIRKGKSIAPGVRVGVSKTGLGVSVGAKGARKTYHTSGRSTSTVGAPGSGVYYRKDSHGAGTSPRRGETRAEAPTGPPPKPGLLAPRSQKQLHKTVTTGGDAEAIEAIGRQHPDVRVVANTLAAIKYLANGHPSSARPLFEAVISSGEEPARHPYYQRCLLGSSMSMTRQPGVEIGGPIDARLVRLCLADIQADDGEIDQALTTLEALGADPEALLLRVDYHRRQGAFDMVVQLTEGVDNTDDLTAALAMLRGVAFREQGNYTAAREAFKVALRARKRTARIRHTALFERAETNLADGKKAQARKDLEKILAEDSTFPGVQDRLGQLSN